MNDRRGLPSYEADGEMAVKKMEKEEAKKTENCGDAKCPFHGDLRTRGRVFEGTVVSDRMQKSVIVEWPRVIKSRKYNRFARLTSRVKAHNPACINVRMGDRVRLSECRKVSRTIGFVVTEKIAPERLVK